MAKKEQKKPVGRPPKQPFKTAGMDAEIFHRLGVHCKKIGYSRREVIDKLVFNYLAENE